MPPNESVNGTIVARMFYLRKGFSVNPEGKTEKPKHGCDSEDRLIGAEHESIFHALR